MRLLRKLKTLRLRDAHVCLVLANCFGALACTCQRLDQPVLSFIIQRIARSPQLSNGDSTDHVTGSPFRFDQVATRLSKGSRIVRSPAVHPALPGGEVDEMHTVQEWTAVQS